jgi:hypothetical protein
LEKYARASFESVAPTVTASGSDAGDLLAALPLLLPAATATMMPARCAAATALLTAWLLTPPSDMDSTEGRWLS